MTVSQMQEQFSAKVADANQFVIMLFGVLVTFVFFAILWSMPDTPFREMFYNPNMAIAWVPPTEVFLAAWSLTLLGLKGLRHREQELSLKLDVIPEQPSDIAASNVNTLVENIRLLPKSVQKSFLVTRVLRALAHFRVRKSRGEVAAFLKSQSEIDASTVASSYTMVKAFIWAIPILGFTGTVIGIGTAVDGFSGLADLENLNETLAVVTTGLAGAFETTLIALVLSMVVMFPAAAMEKSEQDSLNRIDEYCNDQFLQRLIEPTYKEDLDPDKIGRSVAEKIATSLLDVAPKVGSAIAETFESSLARWTEEFFNEMTSSVHQSLSPVVAEVRKITDVIAAQIEEVQKMKDAVGTLGDEVLHSNDQLAQTLKASTTEFQSTSNEIQESFRDYSQAITSATIESKESSVKYGETIRGYSGELTSMSTKVISRLSEIEVALSENGQQLAQITKTQDKVATDLQLRNHTNHLQLALTEMSSAIQQMATLTNISDVRLAD